MMFSKPESLPVHGGNNRFNNGVSNIPVVNKNVRNLPPLIVAVVLEILCNNGRSFFDLRNRSFFLSLALQYRY